MRAWRSCGLLACLLAGRGSDSRAVGPDPVRAEGKALFHREWVPNDPRSHGGDGLGPVYNERSCVACHKQGGAGGSGPAENNVNLVTAPRPSPGATFDGSSVNAQEVLDLIHLGFRDSPSVVFHRFGTDPAHAAWLVLWEGMLKDPRGVGVPGLSIRWTGRNTPALFGSGRIDAITEEALEAGAARVHPGFSGVKGRVCRLPDGRIGRFGWKAQTATLEDFVLTACAGEVGLEVPGHHQSKPPRPAADPPPGLDMTEEECAALVKFVRRLPVPASRRPERDDPARFVASGEELFHSTGCAACHAPKLGQVEGIYSDLLLHNMGPSLSDSGAYYGGPSAAGELARAEEWRTPPLWGVADSAPYLHDGRAKSLDDAIRAHAGEAQGSASRYINTLKPGQRLRLQAFLGTLTAPGSPARVEASPPSPRIRLTGAIGGTGSARLVRGSAPGR